MTEKLLPAKLYLQTGDWTCGPTTAMMILNALGVIEEMSKFWEFAIYEAVRFTIDGTTPSALLGFLKEQRVHAELFVEVTPDQKWWVRVIKKYSEKIYSRTGNSLFRNAIIFGKDILRHSMRSRHINLQTYRNMIDDGKYIASIRAINDEGTALHWMVVDGYRQGEFHISDPAFGSNWISENEFERLTNTAIGRFFIAVSK